MSKNKIIALVIWVITLALPFRIGFLREMQPDMLTLGMFVLTIAGVGGGAYFFSKKENTGDVA